MAQILFLQCKIVVCNILVVLLEVTNYPPAFLRKQEGGSRINVYVSE